jgi:hypothetical protein
VIPPLIILAVSLKRVPPFAWRLEGRRREQWSACLALLSPVTVSNQQVETPLLSQ